MLKKVIAAILAFGVVLYIISGTWFLGSSAQVPSVNSGTAVYPSSGTISSAPLYDNAGGIKNSAHMVVGTANLSLGQVTITLSGASVYSTSSSYVCTTTDTSGAASVTSSQNQSGSQFKVFGTVNDAIAYSCVGN